MPGSFDLDENYAPLVQPALSVGVYRYTPASGGEGPGSYELIPNVRCLRIDNRAGGEPPCARFEYVMSRILEVTFGFPSQFEQLWPIDAQGDYVVSPDDRIVVAALNPDGTPEILFDGFAQVPQVDASGDGQRVTFAAVNVAARCSDDVILTRVQRDADTPDDTSGDSDYEVHLPCRFNPAGTRANGTQGFLPNSTPNANYTVLEDEDGYPVFIEPLLAEREIAEGEPPATYVAPWYVGDALLYLLVQPNPGDPYITWPDAQEVQDLLQTLVPDPTTGVFDPATASKADCILRDYDATNKPLPRVLADLLGYAGFYYAWATDASVAGNPETFMRIFRVDAAEDLAPRALYLNRYGQTLDPALNNACRISLARDLAQVVNAWRVDTGPKQVELTVTLAPAFTPAAADAAPASSPTGGWNAFKSSNLQSTDADSARRRKYRWFVADECGDGHYDVFGQQWSVKALDLSPVFPNTDTNTRSYSVRYRPGKDRLISVDNAGVPRKATLEVQIGSSMSDPAVQRGSHGTWLPITRGWKLLDDRLGIEVTIEDPEQWHTGNPDPTAGVLRTITWLAKSGDPASKQFALRLTVVIDADDILEVTAAKRLASPTRFSRWRSIDAADHFRHQTVAPGSLYYQGDGTKPTVVRDDTKPAQAHATQLRSRHEMPETAGSVAIPYITTYYRVGDRIEEIDGRDVSMQTNVGASAGEKPAYPWIAGVSWSFEGGRQQTILQLSDHRGERVDNAW